jgi:hypothetical protein
MPHFGGVRMSSTYHLEFEAEGTRYDLVLVMDPYGGWLVVWSVMGWVMRYYESSLLDSCARKNGELKPLTKNINKYDLKNIEKFLQEEF